MTEQLSRHSRLESEPGGGAGAAAGGGAATQVTAASTDPSQPQNDLAAPPPQSSPVHAEYLQLDERATDPIKIDDQTLLFARADGQVYSRDDANNVWPVSERVYDVRAYGAQSGTKSQAAIQAAITAASQNGGGVVELGDASNTYIIESTLRLDSNIVLRGQATIQFADGMPTGATMLNIGGKNRVVIEGLTLDGNNNNQTTGGHVGIQISNNAASNDDIVIRGVHIQNVSGKGIRVGTSKTQYTSERVRIEDCVIEGTGGHAIWVQRNAPGIIIRGNSIKNTGKAGNGVYCTHESNRVLIANNSMYNIGRIGIEVFPNIQDVIVAGNLIYNDAVPGRMGISLAGVTRATVTGNIIKHIGWLSLEITLCNYVSVAGNTIDSPVTNSSRGIAINGSQHVSISGGVIRNASYPIMVTSNKQNPRTVSDGAMTKGADTLTSATANFTEDDVGVVVQVSCAGEDGGVLETYIGELNSATQVTLVDAASQSVSNAQTVVDSPSDGVRDVTISGVVFENSRHAAINTQGSHTIYDLVIASCVATDVPTFVNRGTGSAERVVIKGNTVANWTSPTGLTLDRMRGVTIIGNTFSHDLEANKQAIHLLNGGRYVVQGNIIQAGSGLDLMGTAITLENVEDAIVDGNVIWATSGSTATGINLTGNTQHVILKGNRITGYTGTGGTAINIASTVKNTIVEGNLLTTVDAQGNVVPGNANLLSNAAAVGQVFVYTNPLVDGTTGPG